MKKRLFLSILLSSFIALGAYAGVVKSLGKNNNGTVTKRPSGGVMVAPSDDVFNSMYIDLYAGQAVCNKRMTICRIGSRSMHSNPSKPLKVFDTKSGKVVCNYERTRCTNGEVVRTSKTPMY